MNNRELAEQMILDNPNTAPAVRKWLMDVINARCKRELEEIEQKSKKQFESLKDIQKVETDGKPLQATPEWFDQENEELKKSEPQAESPQVDDGW
jgi:hypothetical protein